MSISEVQERDHLIAADLAENAGTMLLDIRKKIGTEISADEAKALGDKNSHDYLMARLSELCPDDAVLSEEGEDDVEARTSSKRVWIVDPLDGTREFGEPPREDWAVHVALAIDGELAAGAVALPARSRTLSTARPVALSSHPNNPPRMVVSRSRPPEVTGLIASTLGAELIPMGSAGAKTSAVILGEAEIYFHSGGQYEWDSAAPIAVAERSGLHVSRIDGSRLCYNQPNPWLPDLLVCHPSLADTVLAALTSAIGL